MLILNEPVPGAYSPVLKYVPPRIRKRLFANEMSTAEELRLNCGLPPVVYTAEGRKYVSERGLTDTADKTFIVTSDDIRAGVELICASSVYAVEEELRAGFVTVEGGSRVGLCGRAVTEGGAVSFIKNVSSLNYRFPREVINCSERVIEQMCSGGKLRSTLIISPPGCGKTTMLRDIARSLSYSGYKVSIADERREIAGMHGGVSGFDIGFSDVLEGVDKSIGMITMLRSMSPEVIVADEIGTAADIRAMQTISTSGVVLVASVHARSIEELQKRAELKGLLPLFECFAVLSREHGTGTIAEVRLI